jgi:hypothetical protein
MLSKFEANRKLSLLFKINDVDEDGCLSESEISRMLQNIERVFNLEKYFNVNSESNKVMQYIKSKNLINNISYINARIYSNIVSNVYQHLKNRKEAGNLEKKSSEQDDLITWAEFHETIESLPKFKNKFLAPSQHSLKNILMNGTVEDEIV